MARIPKLAIIGATGAVGRRMVSEVERSGLLVDVSFFASERSSGKTISYRGMDFPIRVFSAEEFRGFQYALMSAGGDFSRQFAPKIVASGCTVIDNSSAWRMNEDVPLVVPEVNLSEILSRHHPRIIANPNCSTIQLVVCLEALRKKFGLTFVNVSTMQSVSGSGQKGISELQKQEVNALPHQSENSLRNYSEPTFYPKPILRNLIPAIDVIKDGGHGYEEEKIIRETRKILNLPDLPVFASTVRVPVYYAHSEAVTVGLGCEVSRQDLHDCFESAEGIVFHAGDRYEDFPDPLSVAGHPEVYVGRARLPFGETRSHIVQFWNVADNLLKGAATNAVQILLRLLQGS